VDRDWKLPGKRATLQLRAHVFQALRAFFAQEGFLEVETPLRIPAPAPEAHIATVPSGDWYLQPSPELCMKRLLAAGYHQLFQIAKCFRARERGDRHLPEFTMLEWYRAGCDYRALMEDCEALIGAAAAAAGRRGAIRWQGRSIDLSPPWERITVQEAFARYAGISSDEALAQDRFDEILVTEVEPHLGMARPCFLCDYPAALGSLARLKPGDPAVAERFELYVAGLELANGFSELTDAVEQRSRFAAVVRDQARQGLRLPMPEPFLEALTQMPEAAGIALGLDRLVMLLADAATIDAVVAFPPETL
jgi:lysyl-tRNA synthetase class 2